MDLIAVNVLMDPDPDTVRRARAVNGRLRTDFPQGFALDENHAPHVTLVQCFVRRQDIAEIAQAVSAALRSAPPVNWTSRAVGIYALSDGNFGLAGIVIEPTEDLRRVQKLVSDALSPFMVHEGTGAAFAARLDGAPIGQATIDYVKGFAAQRTGTNYNPHLTVGIGTSGFVEALKAEPFEASPYRALSISLYQLGDYGVAQKKLDDLHAC